MNRKTFNDSMLPILLEIGPIKIYTFGVFLTLSFFWGCFLLWKVIRLSSYKEDDVFDGLFLGLFMGLVMGRMTYVFLHGSEFGFNIAKIVLINGYPGISLIGCIFGGLLGSTLFLSTKKIKFLEIIDYFISPLFLSIAIGKLGSFFSGSEVGTRTKIILSVKYANLDGLRHLTPLYEGLLFFLGAFIAYKLLFLIRKNVYQKSFSLYFFIWFFSLVEFAFDGLKQYRLYMYSLSFNFIVSILLLLTFSFYFLYYFRSLIIKKISLFTNFIQSHAKKIHKRVSPSAKRSSS